MKKIMLAGTIASSLLLASCNEIDPATLAAIQNAAVSQCAFLPTAINIAGVFPQYNSITTPIATVASLICAAIRVQVPLSVRRRTGMFKGNQDFASPVSILIRLPNGTTATVTGKFVR